MAARQFFFLRMWAGIWPWEHDSAVCGMGCWVFMSTTLQQTTTLFKLNSLMSQYYFPWSTWILQSKPKVSCVTYMVRILTASFGDTLVIHPKPTSIHIWMCSISPKNCNILTEESCWVPPFLNMIWFHRHQLPPSVIGTFYNWKRVLRHITGSWDDFCVKNTREWICLPISLHTTNACPGNKEGISTMAGSSGNPMHAVGSEKCSVFT